MTPLPAAIRVSDILIVTDLETVAVHIPLLGSEVCFIKLLLVSYDGSRRLQQLPPPLLLIYHPASQS